MGRPIFARRLSPQERDELDTLLHHPLEALTKRATIILLSSEEHFRASEISFLVGLHTSSIRYWIHRFNEEGVSALHSYERQRSRIAPDVRAMLIQLATTPPRRLGLKFTIWTLRELKEYLVERDIVEEISHETIRRILKDENIDWRMSGTLTDNSLIPNLLGTSALLERSRRKE